MKPTLFTLLLLFVFSCFFNSLIAQKISGGIFLGGANYQGDLVEVEMLPRETNPAIGLLARYQLTNKLFLKGSIYAGHISGSDANSISQDRLQRGLSFRTSMLEGSAAIEWTLLGKERFDRKGFFSKTFSPYLFLGIGMLQFHPKVLGLPENVPDSQKDYKKIDLIFPFGGGIKYDLTDRITLGFEASTHLPFTDYLDGVSEQGTVNRDWYAWGGITACYWFGSPQIATRGDKTKTGSKF